MFYIFMATSITWTQTLGPDPGPELWTLNLDPGPGPRTRTLKTWTIINLDPEKLEKPLPLKT